MDRVQKLLSNYGHCSRRMAEWLIEKKRVRVNGRIISLGFKAGDNDKITVDGKEIKRNDKIYLMLNKPVGYVTALRDDKLKTVMEFIKIKERVFPIGRLDFNTSGLLLLTNDGDFANDVAHPSKEVKKTYLVELYNEITEKKIRRIVNGTMVDDRKTSPAEVKVLNENLFEITIHEGRNRIVRKILKKLKLRVKTLKRIKIGKLELDKLGEGNCRMLDKKEIMSVFK